MKRKGKLLALLSLLLPMIANADTNSGTGFVGNGYYHIRNMATDRYIYVTDNKDYYDPTYDYEDFQAIQLWSGAERTVSDPASVIYIQEGASGLFDLKAQSTNLYSIFDRECWRFTAAQTDDGSYEVFSTGAIKATPIDNLATYTGNAPYVYDQKSLKYYALNNLGEYEEYGIFTEVNTLKVAGTSVTEIEYIKTNTSMDIIPYINLNYIPKANSKAICTLVAEEGVAWKAAYGCGYFDGDWKDRFCFFTTNATINLGGETGNSSAMRYGEKIVTVLDAVAGKMDIFEADGTTLIGTISDSPKTADCKTPLYVFAQNKDVPGGSRNTDCINPYVTLYGLQLYEGETLVMDLVPAINGEGKAGLKDKLTGSFYSSANEGNFEVSDDGKFAASEAGIPVYEGKMVIYNDHQYEYTCGSFVDKGELTYSAVPEIGTSYRNLSNWSYPGSTYDATFGVNVYDATTGSNILNPFEGKGGWEPLYFKLTGLTKGESYRVSFNYTGTAWFSWGSHSVLPFYVIDSEIMPYVHFTDDSALGFIALPNTETTDQFYSTSFETNHDYVLLCIQFGVVDDGSHHPAFAFSFNDIKVEKRTFPVAYRKISCAGQVTRYLSDNELSDDEEGMMGTGGPGTYRRWIVDKIETNHATNYVGIKPTIQVGDKYYQSYYASFAFRTISSDMRVYYISKIVGNEAILKEINGDVPAGTPVIIECASENPTDNRIEPLTSNPTKISGNLLDGAYFCNGSRPRGSVDAYRLFDESTMRVFTEKDGRLIVTNNAEERLVWTRVWDPNDSTSTRKIRAYCIPANTSYLTTDTSSPAELGVRFDSGTNVGVEINEVNFPDENFRNYLLHSWNGSDGILTEEEIANTTYLNISYCDIKSLKGIEFFTALTELDCYHNQLTVLDLSKNEGLTYLVCDYNNLTSLDVSKNTKLRTLYGHRNQLLALDVSGCTALTTLTCDYNQLTELDVSRNTKLQTLHCNDNNLTALDVSKNTKLNTLNLSNNKLAGDIGLFGERLTAGQEIPITTLNISDNKLSGNIGLFAKSLPNLTALYAHWNCLEDVIPMISTSVTKLSLGFQTILRVVPLHLADFSSTDLMTKIPTILLYDHENRTYSSNNIELCGMTSDFGFVLDYKDGQMSMPDLTSENDTYYGESGDTLDVVFFNKNHIEETGLYERSTFRTSLSFDDGDGNFDGQVNVLDLQASLNYMFHDYNNKPFNFTASNLYRDEVINVQDVVLMVDKLLDAGQPNNIKMNGRVRVREEALDVADACLYWRGNDLILNTSTGVAAADICLSGDASITWSLQQMGFIVTEKKDANVTHAVIYSLSDAEIPVGETVIAHGDEGCAEPVSAMLSDRQAAPVSVSLTASEATAIAKLTAVNGDWSIFRTDGTIVAQGTGSEQLASARKHLATGVYILLRENNNTQKFIIK